MFFFFFFFADGGGCNVNPPILFIFYNTSRKRLCVVRSLLRLRPLRGRPFYYFYFILFFPFSKKISRFLVLYLPYRRDARSEINQDGTHTAVQYLWSIDRHRSKFCFTKIIFGRKKGIKGKTFHIVLLSIFYCNFFRLLHFTGHSRQRLDFLTAYFLGLSYVVEEKGNICRMMTPYAATVR